MSISFLSSMECFGGDLGDVNWIPSKSGGLRMGFKGCSRGGGLEKALMMTFLLSRGGL